MPGNVPVHLGEREDTEGSAKGVRGLVWRAPGVGFREVTRQKLLWCEGASRSMRVVRVGPTAKVGAAWGLW